MCVSDMIKFGCLSLLKPLQRVTIAQTTTRHDIYVRISTKPAAKLLWNYIKECIKNNQETSVQGVFVLPKKTDTSLCCTFKVYILIYTRSEHVPHSCKKGTLCSMESCSYRTVHKRVHQKQSRN